MTPADERLARDLIAFARAPSTTTFAALPLADRVSLGLGDRLLASRASSDLMRREAWELQVSEFQGFVGPFSVLNFLARNEPMAISVGPHSHCAGPPLPAPAGITGHKRVSIQPTNIDSCILWWSVDMFVAPSGRIDAITLDLFGP